MNSSSMEPQQPPTPPQPPPEESGGSSARKSQRHRNSPSRYIARPSHQGMGVEEGDRAFFRMRSEKAAAAAAETTRISKHLRERQDVNLADGGVVREEVAEEEGTKRSKRIASMNNNNNMTCAQNDNSMDMTPNKSNGAGSKNMNANNKGANKHSDRKRPPESLQSTSASASKSQKKKQRKSHAPLGSGAPHPPRVIIIGAGISGLACARELSERRHDVLVVEARNRLGGRLRTIDLMLDKEWNDPHAEVASDLERVKNWSPVDVGGAFIHGTGVNMSVFNDEERGSQHVGSHDFGTSNASKRRGSSGDAEKKKEGANNNNANAKKPPVRKSERQKQQYKSTNNDGDEETTKIMESTIKDINGTVIRRAEDGIGSLNPVYVLARQKLRLPLHAAEGAYTCLVDHDGNLISDDVDQKVSEEFNDVLDLATKCCDEGRCGWKETQQSAADSASNATKASTNGESKETNAVAAAVTSSSQHGIGDVSRSPNYVSDDTNNNPQAVQSTATTENGGGKIDTATDFGTIFEECKKYHKTTKSESDTTSPTTANQQQNEDVCKHLFNWHVAQLEMSSGAPMAQLGQKWNDDEPFGYGGDHSYLEGGMRDVIEALAEGFDCRGIGDRSILGAGPSNKGGNYNLRSSGDFASTFGRHSNQGYYLDSGTTSSRGVIQCGIEVTGVKIIEKEEVKLVRKQKKQPVQVKVDESSLRRSSRENRGSKMTSFLDALAPRSNSGIKSTERTAETEPPNTATYGNERNTVVHVTTKCGLTLEADAVIVTTPLAILSIPPGSPGHISFNPPLPSAKQNALNRLGVGAYNKCCMSFEKPFWNSLPRNLSASSKPGNWNDEATQRFDFIGHASAEYGKDILFFCLRNAPILIAIHGGSDYSKQVEGMHDEAVVLECMQVLKKICSRALKARDVSLRTRQQVDLTVPDWPIDFFVSRWGSDPFSRGAFSYVPAGVNGFEELKAMSRPINDYRPEWEEESNKTPKRPLILFAGEATTPYHPSTIHGAFETGIREAYRLDLALEPELNGTITFDESFLYQPTFSVRRGQTDPKTVTATAPGPTTQISEPITKTDTASKWWFDHDASILRGVESFGLSRQTMTKIKSKVLTPSGDIHNENDMQDRYKSLMRMIATHQDHTATSNVESNWKLPGRRGSWLAANITQQLVPIASNRPGVAGVKPDDTQDDSEMDNDNLQTRRSSRMRNKKVDASFSFY